MSAYAKHWTFGQYGFNGCLTVVAMMIFGSESILSFSVALTVGLIGRYVLFCLYRHTALGGMETEGIEKERRSCYI